MYYINVQELVYRGLDPKAEEKAMQHCAWCGASLSEVQDPAFVPITALVGDTLSEYQGHMVEVALPSKNRWVPMVVSAEGSQAKLDGADFSFVVCSMRCGHRLKAAMKGDTVLSES